MGDIVRSAEMWFYKPFEGKYVASSPSEDIQWRVRFLHKEPTLEEKTMCRVYEFKEQWYSMLTDDLLLTDDLSKGIPKHLHVEIGGGLYEFVVEVQKIDQHILANEYSLAANTHVDFEWTGKGRTFEGWVKGNQVAFQFKLIIRVGQWGSKGTFVVQSITSNILDVSLSGAMNTNATISLVPEDPANKLYWPSSDDDVIKAVSLALSSPAEDMDMAGSTVDTHHDSDIPVPSKMQFNQVGSLWRGYIQSSRQRLHFKFSEWRDRKGNRADFPSFGELNVMSYNRETKLAKVIQKKGIWRVAFFEGFIQLCDSHLCSVSFGFGTYI